jgi:hypothetical protein
MEVLLTVASSRRYWVEEKGFKIVEIGGNKVYVHPLVSDHDIHQDAVVGGGMPLHTAGTPHSCPPLFVRQKCRVSHSLEYSNVECRKSNLPAQILPKTLKKIQEDVVALFQR